MIFVLREFQNGNQLGNTVKIDAENLKGAKMQATRLLSIFADEQHIENEVGAMLAKRTKGLWKAPFFLPSLKPGRKSMKKESTDPVFVVRELRNNQTIQVGTIQAKNLDGLKRRAFRFAENMDSVLTVETPDGVLLAKREEGWWQRLS
jgi:hypothetical protein